MTDERSPDFLSLRTRVHPSDDESESNPVQPALGTLFSEFNRRHRSISPTVLPSPRNPHRSSRDVEPRPVARPVVDLRALDYPSDYDDHLMCPICHVPLIDPIVLDCDHTFCTTCFQEYRAGQHGGEQSQCPSCRTYVLGNPKKASRLIVNMCNEIKVSCPNEGCQLVIARGYLDKHISKDCPEQLIHCPDLKCDRQTKRKNYVPNQCIHASHIECECGAVIALGKGEWLEHKDAHCPKSKVKCGQCDEQIPVSEYLAGSKKHACRATEKVDRCLGEEFGCVAEIQPGMLDEHVKTCTLARLAPHLQKQSRLVSSLQEQLTTVKMRNEVLELGLERISDLVTAHIHPRQDNASTISDQDIEEIQRDHIPASISIDHSDLFLPAPIHDLTTSPASSHRAVPTVTSYQYLLGLHETLHNNVSSIQSEINRFHQHVAELDARTSMQIMNETLRLREDLAHTNAGLFSTRSQVQWLLNRERMSREMISLGMRGRQGSYQQQQQQSQQSQPQHQAESQAAAQTEVGTSANPSQSSTTAGPGPSNNPRPDPIPLTNLSRQGSSQSSTSTSPNFAPSAYNPNSTRRPSLRRLSGSQERFKL